LYGSSIFVKEVHSLKAYASIVFTVLGIIIAFKDAQPQNVASFIVFILHFITIDVSLEQRMYLQPIITQYFIDNKSEIWLLFLIAHSKR